jgi:hypothetical protein
MTWLAKIALKFEKINRQNLEVVESGHSDIGSWLKQRGSNENRHQKIVQNLVDDVIRISKERIKMK